MLGFDTYNRPYEVRFQGHKKEKGSPKYLQKGLTEISATREGVSLKGKLYILKCELVCMTWFALMKFRAYNTLSTSKQKKSLRHQIINKHYFLKCDPRDSEPIEKNLQWHTNLTCKRPYCMLSFL